MHVIKSLDQGQERKNSMNELLSAGNKHSQIHSSIKLTHFIDKLKQKFRFFFSF